MSLKKAPFIFLLFLIIFSGCKVLTPFQQPDKIQLPSSYRGKSDTSSIGTMNFHSFFKDSILIALIDSALKNNYDLKMALQRVEMVNREVQRAKAPLFPSVNAAASAGVDKYGDYTMNGVGNFDTNLSDNLKEDQRIPNPTPDFFLGIRSSWEVDIWGKLRNRKKAAYSRFLASQKGRLLVQTALVAEVASRYFELVALDNELNIIRKNVKLQREALEIIKVQKEGGRATELAVQQFQAQLLRTLSLEIEKEQNIYKTENQLNVLLGRFGPADIERVSMQRQSLPEEISTGVPSEMLLRRPDIQQAEYEMVAANLDVQAARAAALPSLTINPYVGFNSFDISKLLNPASLAAGILGGIAAPVVNRNKVKANYGSAVARNLETYYAYNKSIIKAYQEVLTNLKSLENLKTMKELKAQEVDVLQRAVETSNDLFISGFASYLEVVTAQRNVLEAELGLVAIRKNQFLSLIQLYRSLGGGW